MATSVGRRVAAFLLALLFFMSTVGAAGFVIWEIRRSDSGLVDTAQIDEVKEEPQQTCGQAAPAATEPRSIPTTTKADGAVNELQKVDVKTGEGEEVQAGDCVTALYYGTLAKDGTKFDGNYETGQPIEFSLNGVIAGWTEGIPGMRVGGVRRLVIPAAKAYGEEAQGSIPANSDLIFEVEIVATRRGE